MFPTEIITLLASVIITALLKLWMMKMKSDAQRWELALQRGRLLEESRESARQFGGRPVNIARRVIVLAAVFYLFVAPFLLVCFRPDVSIYYGYPEKTRGFLFLWESLDQMKFKELKGLVFLPLHTHTLSAIVGFYFGGRIVD